MKRISAKFYRSKRGHVFYCPGCEQLHLIPDSWDFNGDLEHATFSPSIKQESDVVCHYFLRDGKLIYCSDSWHKLAGQTVPLPDIPEGW